LGRLNLNIEYPEGATPLDPDEMEGLKFRHVTNRSELDHLEQGNIQSGLTWLQRYKSKNILDEHFIRKLHERLFGDVWNCAGTFRSTEKNIGVDPSQISTQLQLLLDDTTYWINNLSYEPLEIAIRFHHRIVSIHLFPNGNGRHARIMADALLTRLLDLKPIDWTGGHDLQNSNVRRDQYIQALRAADKGNIEPLLSFVSNNQYMLRP